MRSIFVALALACAWALPAQAALFGEDVDITARKQIAEQQRRFDALSQRFDETAARIAKLEDTVKQQAQNQPVLELANQMQVMREELRTIRGQLEVLTNNLDAAAKRQRDMYVDLDTRLRRFEQGGPPAAGAPPGAPPPPGAGAETRPPPAAPAAAVTGAAAADEQRVYEAAQQQRRVGNYQGAIAGFQGFVQQFGRSTLAHRAQYWIGDSYYNLRDFKNAIAAQQKLLATYPDSASVPDAMLNMASSYIELGDTAAAKKTMDTLVTRYPSSEAAEKAKRRLAALH
jgi:tol-pal system protein YbgF